MMPVLFDKPGVSGRTSARPIIVVIGDVMLDRYVDGNVERISPEAPVPVLVHKEERSVPGGAANVAVNIAALDCRVKLVGRVGADAAGDELRQLLRRSGIDTDHLVTDSCAPTISKTRIVSNQHQFFRIDREIITAPGPDIESAVIDATSDALRDAAILIVSDYAKGILSDRVLRAVIKQANALNVPVLVDPKRKQFDVYDGAALIKPNARELAQATGYACETDEDIERAAAKLRSQFSGTLLVTRSERGMSLFRNGAPPRHFALPPLEVADVSGAGDTVLAALAVALAEGSPIEAAVEISNVAGSLAVGKVGTAIVSKSELLAAIARNDSAKYIAGSLVSLEKAAEIAANWRRMGETIVFTNGCFDLVHTGHIELLSSAAKHGTRLILGLNSDASTRQLKGPSRPIQNQEDRARVAGALRTVDLVVIFDELTPTTLIEKIRPDVLVKGADYREEQVVGGDFVKSYGGKVALIPLVAEKSSTQLVKRMRG